MADYSKQEEIAFREAFDLFMKKLVSTIGSDGVARLANTTHVHTTFMSTGEKSMICTTQISFSDKDEAIRKALEEYQGPIGSG